MFHDLASFLCRGSGAKPPPSQLLEDATFQVAVVDFRAPDAAQKFTDSLKKTGFAVLTNHPVPEELISGVYSEWREFLVKAHQTPRLTAKYMFNTATQSGYFPMAVSETAKGAKVKDLKHYYQLYFPNGQYPREEVSDAAERLWTELVTLGKTLVGWIDEHMPPEAKKAIGDKIGEGRALADCVSEERTMMRVLHYPGYAEGEEEVGAVRAAAHEDINLITVLPAGSARGLQVKANQSGEWHEVPLVEGSVIINIGDMLQEMTEGAYLSTTHRVIKMEEAGSCFPSCFRWLESWLAARGWSRAKRSFVSNDRMSTPCFIHPKGKCPISSEYGSAEHFLIQRLVACGVMPQGHLDDFLKAHPGGKMPGWSPDEE